MNSLKVLFHSLRYRLRDLPFNLNYSDSEISILVDESRSPRFKEKSFSFLMFQKNLAPFAINITDKQITIPKEFEVKKFRQLLTQFETIADLCAKENLHDDQIWGRFPTPHSTGFKEGTLPESTALLNEVYADKYIVPEKKAFVIDLRRSHRTHLISIDKNPKSFFDAAAQIGSLALGYNDPEKRGIITHAENYEWCPDVFKSETYRGYSNLLKKLSGMPHVYFFNSGAEANEAALQICIRAYPKRKRILAFNGSFHGRSLLTIHLTHSPAKRTPFEIYPELVNFAPFPENKKPSETIKGNNDWITLWGSAKASDFSSRLEKLKSGSDPLMSEEINSLLYIKAAFEKEEYLATMIEPRQCEGGDRFATARFYQGLRLLTRAFDVPLLFDEVQTGFGLGGPFFWHELFDLKKPDGTRDYPDTVSFAKKAQVAGVLSLRSAELKHEVSLTSLHRGYLQAMSTLVHDPVDFDYVYKQLLEFQKTLGANIIQNPRGQAQTFAFDLESDTLLNKLLTYRFEEGILFYPAGDKTARFRLLRNFTHQEIDGLFISLYKCFLRASKDGLIPEVPALETWLAKIPRESHSMCSSNSLNKVNPWATLPHNLEQIKNTPQDEWKSIFGILLKEQRNCIQLASNSDWTIEKLNSTQLDDLISEYKNNPEFTWLDLLWQSSRQQGWKVETVKDLKTLSQMKDQIEKLEEECYEPARQTEYSEFETCLSDNSGQILVCRGEKDILGIAACGRIEKFKSLKLLKDDPENSHPDIYYSIDVTVQPKILHKALGLRLKTEQILGLTHKGGKAIRSRNRFPEAAPMIRLNHGYGSQVLAQEENVYDDGGSAFYQSLKLNKTPGKIWNARHPSMLNKGSLGNFVSPAFVDNLLILKELLPKEYRHVYLASSRAEALDKAIKCFRHFRPKGKMCISFEGDNFGNTTTSTSQLSGEVNYFNWPKFKNENDPAFLDFVKNTPNEHIFGAILEWKNNTSIIKQRIEALKTHGIPSAVKECASSFWNGSKKSFVLSGSELNPDIFYLGLGPQVAVVACKESFFVDKLLAMISTWEGDEHGLCLFQDHVLDVLETL